MLSLSLSLSNGPLADSPLMGFNKDRLICFLPLLFRNSLEMFLETFFAIALLESTGMRALDWLVPLAARELPLLSA